MKKNAFFGLLTILLVFGFTSCDNGNNDVVNDAVHEKKLIIENIGVSGDISIILMDAWGPSGNRNAGGTATSVVSGSNVTITLKTVENLSISSTNWTGSGNYVVYLFTTLTLGQETVPNYGAPTHPNFISFENQTTTVNWSKFGQINN